MYYTGELSRFTEKTLSETYNQDRIMVDAKFERLPFSDLEPLLASDEAFSEYDRPVGYSWVNNPYSKGSYTYIAPGQESCFSEVDDVLGEKAKTLFSPIDNSLFFAGEHTTLDTDILGTMEAAAESGDRTARMILNAIEKKATLDK